MLPGIEINGFCVSEQRNSFALFALLFKIHVYACCLLYFAFHKG